MRNILLLLIFPLLLAVVVISALLRRPVATRAPAPSGGPTNGAIAAPPADKVGKNGESGV